MQQLERRLGLLDTTMIIVGIVIVAVVLITLYWLARR